MTPLVMGMVVACSMIMLLLICCWCLSCTRCRWWFTLPMARSRREKERRRKALTAKLAVERGRDTLRSTLARRPRSRCCVSCAGGGNYRLNHVIRSVKARRAPNPALFKPIIRLKAPDAPQF